MEAHRSKIINLMAYLLASMKKEGESWQAISEDAFLFNFTEEQYSLVQTKADRGNELAIFQENIIIRGKEDRGIVWQPTYHPPFRRQPEKVVSIFSIYEKGHHRLGSRSPRFPIFDPDPAS